MTETTMDPETTAAVANVVLAKDAGQEPALHTVVTVDKRVEQYIQIRDELARRKKAYEESIEPLMQVQNMLTGWMQNFLDQSGADSIKTAHGTCYTSTKYSASLADPAAFMAYVKESGKFDLLDRKANVTACKDFVAEHGVPPVGVNMSAIKTIGVRRA